MRVRRNDKLFCCGTLDCQFHLLLFIMVINTPQVRSFVLYRFSCINLMLWIEASGND